MKRIICILSMLMAIIISTITLCSCNAGIVDFNLKINYVVLNENGNMVLHKVKTWYDTESDSASFKLSCCDNYIWTSSNVAIAYTNKPMEHAYDFECVGG